MHAGYTSYRGRFAPTPSGPLHLGSLLTALASWLQARRRGGQWLLRFDDLDALRCPPGTESQILAQLAAHGLEWDAEPVRQRSRSEIYRAALEDLKQRDLVYACGCTRRALKARAMPQDDIYDGHCRHLALPLAHHALRLRTGPGRICMIDAGRGTICRDLETGIGDFVVWRSDGVPGYQLASVIDDRDMGITEIVRGADLLHSSLRQCHLFERLRLPVPRFRHLPVLVDREGRKLSKQNHAQALDGNTASSNLWRCLRWLGQTPPSELRGAPVQTLLDWARTHWNEAAMPAAAELQLEPHA